MSRMSCGEVVACLALEAAPSARVSVEWQEATANDDEWWVWRGFLERPATAGAWATRWDKNCPRRPAGSSAVIFPEAGYVYRNLVIKPLTATVVATPPLTPQKKQRTDELQPEKPDKRRRIDSAFAAAAAAATATGAAPPIPPAPTLGSRGARANETVDVDTQSEGNDVWDSLGAPMHRQRQQQPPWPVVAGRRYTLVITNTRTKTQDEVSSKAVSATELRLDDGRALKWPPPEHIRLRFKQGDEEDGFTDDEGADEAGVYDINDTSDDVYTLGQVMAFFRREGSMALKARLIEVYKFWASNRRALACIETLLKWVKEHDQPSTWGKELLIEIQVLSAQLQGKDAGAARASLEKDVTGTNPYLKMLAKAPSSSRGRGGQDRGGRGGGGGRGQFFRRGGYNTNSYSTQQQQQPNAQQCNWCGKPKHSSSQCWQKNGNPRLGIAAGPQSQNIIPLPGHYLC